MMGITRLIPRTRVRRLVQPLRVTRPATSSPYPSHASSHASLFFLPVSSHTSHLHASSSPPVFPSEDALPCTSPFHKMESMQPTTTAAIHYLPLAAANQSMLLHGQHRWPPAAMAGAAQQVKGLGCCKGSIRSLPVLLLFETSPLFLSSLTPDGGAHHALLRERAPFVRSTVAPQRRRGSSNWPGSMHRAAKGFTTCAMLQMDGASTV